MSDTIGLNAPATTPIWQRGAHITQLDGVRGLAILIVTLYRFGRDMPTDSWLGRILAMPLVAGERGVELFFVLSGFLITGILVDAKAQGQGSYFSNFFARRGLRIFPLYFAALFLFLWLVPNLMASFGATHPFIEAERNQIYLWTYLSNVYMSVEDRWCFGALDHFWSLAVEEHFYLVWPFVVFFCRERTTLWIAVSVGATCCAARTAWAALGISDVAPAVLTVFRCDALLLGACVALVARTPQGLMRWRSSAMWMWPCMLAVGLLIDFSGRRLCMLGAAVWPLAWAGLMTVLLTGHARSLLARVFDLGWLRNLGRYSYAMYVFQSPLIPLMAAVLAWLGVRSFAGGGVSAHLLSMGIMFSLTYALAWLSWHAYEKHWLAMKRWFSAPVMPGADPRGRVDEAIANHYSPALTIALPGLGTDTRPERSPR